MTSGEPDPPESEPEAPMPEPEPEPEPEPLTLAEAAERLGVHYMTAYRWVRLGRLAARKVDGVWAIDPSAVDGAAAGRARPGPAPRRRPARAARATAWQARLKSPMLAGDVAASWQVIESALASGLEPRDTYVDVLAPVLHQIGDAWQAGEVGIEQEHLASGVAAALIGRLGPRFGRRGRKKGVVVLAMPAGERHGLGLAMLADLLTEAGFEVRNLGPDTPADSLAAAIADVDRLAAVAVAVVDPAARPAAAELLARARRARPDVPLLTGGHAVPDEVAARALGADAWTADPRTLGRLIETLRRSLG